MVNERENNGTWIKLYRKMKHWEWYDDIPTKVLFIELLLTVNNEDKQWHGMTIHRGEIVTSTAKLAAETGLSTKQIRRALNNLEETGEICRQRASKGTLIIVENYRVYQVKPTNEGKQRDTQRVTQRDTQRATTKEYKEYKNKRERERDALPLIASGRKKNVFLTADEKEKIKATFENHNKLINKIGDIIANSNRDYPDHDALLWKIAEEDCWPKKKRQQESARELTKEEKEMIRRQEEEWKNS